jgi:hypothetical protein
VSKGYAGVNVSDGQGPSPGRGTSGQNSSGGAHGGNGGKSSYYNSSIGYCDVTNINTMGSSGGGGNAIGGAGGGLARLYASSTVTLNGAIYAMGGGGSNNLTTAGGAGGGVKIVGDIIAGTPAAFDISGGTPTAYSQGSGGGGGGCAQLTYTTSNSVTASQVVMNGGLRGSSDNYTQSGGSGQLYIKQTTASYGDLYLSSTVTGATASSTLISSLTLNSLSLTQSTLFVSSTRSLTLRNSLGTPFANSSQSAPGTLYVQGTVDIGTDTIDRISLITDRGTFTNSSTLTITSSGLLNLASSTVVSTPLTSVSSSGALFLNQNTIGSVMNGNTSLTINASTTVMAGFTSTTPRLNLSSLSINGGTLTHGTNVDVNNNEINISATNITIGSAGRIDVDGKGYTLTIHSTAVAAAEVVGYHQQTALALLRLLLV